MLDVELDRTEGSKTNNDKAAQILKTYMEDTMMCDVWRDRNEKKRIYTYTRRAVNQWKLVGSRIDLCVSEMAINSWIKNIKILPKFKTDHAALLVDIRPFLIERGKGFWKLNNRILLEPEYVDMINEEIKKTLVREAESEQEKWEMLKLMCIANSQEYSRERARNRNMIISQLEKYIERMEEKANLTTTDEKLLDKTKNDLNVFMDEKVQSAMFRSKAQWFNEGEQMGKYFFGLEKSRSGARGMSSLLNEDGTETVDPLKILKEQKKFYKKLYTKDEKVEFTYKNTENILITDNMPDSLEGKITMQELKLAIKGMKNNVCPGLDSLTTEFYKMFVCKFQDLLLNAINEAFQTGKLHTSALRSVINLIPKRGKDPRIMKNVRPISLLSTDYKCIEKVLANRLKPVLHHIINEDQKGFMSESRISCNIRRILDLIEYTDVNDIPCIIVSIDFLKCFDRIEIKSLVESLRYFGIGPDFIKWTETIYNNPRATVINNGYFSDYFNLERSVKQGGPCSAYYFLVVAEILAIELRKDPNLEGILVDQINKILFQYADDMDLYLYGSAENIQLAFKIINDFCKQTGFKINYDKTTMYRIGSLKKSKAKLYVSHDVNWVENNRYINVLGVNVSNCEAELSQINYEELIPKAQAILNKWQNRGLSLIGKILILNTLIASLFVYKMTVLPSMDESIIKRMHDMCQKFIWNGKKSKIALMTLQTPKILGGLGLVHFKYKDMSLKISWLQSVQKDTLLKQFMKEALSPDLGEEIWFCNLNKKDIRKLFRPSFWCDVLIAWSYINYEYPDCTENIASQFIWLNSLISVKKGPLYI